MQVSTGWRNTADCLFGSPGDNIDHVATQMLRQADGSRWYALFAVPVFQGTAERRDHLFDLRKKGFNRLFQAGTVYEFSSPESLLEIDFSQPLYILADRLAIGGDQRQRIADTTEICYREAGEVIFEEAGVFPLRQIAFSEKFSCKKCRIDFPVPEPSLFSFNNPHGACPRCQGFGNTIDYDMNRVVREKYLPLNQGAVDPWNKPQYNWYWGEFKKAVAGKVRLSVPYNELSREEKALVQQHVRAFFGEVEAKKYKVHVRVFLSRYRGYATCPDCGGSRLRKEAMRIRVHGKALPEVCAMNIEQAWSFFGKLSLTPEESGIAEKVLVEVRQRLQFLHDVGLDYLTLDRLSSTLSGGEAQRIQLATCLGSRLVGACYVLDEPSIGLHPRDTKRLIGILEGLRDLGNTIIVVEHDADVMRAADHVVDLGPGAGEGGGRLVFEGPFRDLAQRSKSLTGRYLRGELKASLKTVRKTPHPKRVITFRGACANNLKNFDVELPLDMMVCVTGVSGSGKSTLVHEVMHRTLAERRKQSELHSSPLADEVVDAPVLTCRSVERADLVHSLVLVDQSPIGRTPRSNPVTYVKAFDQIRDIFANTPDAERRGYAAGHFSFNVPGGRCETCQGDGTVTVEMQFLADVELMCEDCKGRRYKNAVLEARYKGKNVHEVLQLTIKEGISFFANHPKLVGRLQLLADVGLGYLRLGQSATTLSGGEAQRVKLAAHLSMASAKGTLFLFDEPTTGLHFDDIAKLLDAFQRLIRSGGSVLIIEHNLEVIRSADWVIDLGPDGGDAGGRVVATGTPEQVAAVEESYTGQFLRQILES
ncbi:MAG: excinuclease ABC subunit UvrA [Candidatus Solibacter usitatus]|nr:excinuclease ABC subunit UvrA [Candidatus Solibacter usitatus]